MIRQHERIQERREHLGLTQREVALSCGVSQQAYDRLEKGLVLRPRYIVELAAILKTTPQWLTHGGQDAYQKSMADYSFPKELLYENAPQGHYIRTPAKIPVYKYPSDLASVSPFWRETNPIAWLRPIPCLEATTGGGALYITGDELCPIYRPGYTVFFDRNKVPQDGQDCVLNDQKFVRIVQFIRQDKMNYFFKTFDEGADLEVRKSPDFELYKIVGVILS